MRRALLSGRRQPSSGIRVRFGAHDRYLKLVLVVLHLFLKFSDFRLVVLHLFLKFSDFRLELEIPDVQIVVGLWQDLFKLNHIPELTFESLDLGNDVLIHARQFVREL
jgi:hypothetical protein